MARFRLAALSVLLMFASALIAVRTNAAAVTVRIQLFDSATKSPAAGILRISADGKPIELPTLVEDALALLKLVEQARDEIPKQGKFSNVEKRQEVLAVYQGAAERLTKRIGERK